MDHIPSNENKMSKKLAEDSFVRRQMDQNLYWELMRTRRIENSRVKSVMVAAVQKRKLQNRKRHHYFDAGGAAGIASFGLVQLPKRTFCLNEKDRGNERRGNSQYLQGLGLKQRYNHWDKLRCQIFS
jgi:hypothetical protein